MSVTKMKRTSASGSGSGSGSGSPKVLPSPPESVLPSEEDISRGFWQEDEHGGGGGMESEESTMRLKEKGKEKEKEERRRRGDLGRGLDEEYEDEDEVGEVEGGVARYPPTKEQELESRRIQENLRRWELNERQRRKAARESVSSLPPSTSIVADVTRKASLLWSFRGRPKVKRPSASDGGGHHHVLRSTDDLTGADGGGGGGTGVQMDDLDSPGVCVSPSPRLSGEGNGDANPFATPNASTTSFHSSQQRSAIMAESTSSPDGIDSVLTPTSNNSRGKETPTTATHLVVPKPRRAGAGEGPSTTAPPPPKPLDLPEPRTPPPRTETPHANKPPEPIPPPAVLRNEEEEEEVMRPSRWWTDWVCGCVESGDHQAGRTNPFE